MKIQRPFYPIVYVRGYAATMSEIEETVATPYMGFNLGATKMRQDYEGDIRKFIFESPLIRLMKDEGYVDAYREGRYIDAFRDGKPVEGEELAPAKSVWVHRYYDRVSEDVGEGVRRTIPQFAMDLRMFILRVRDQVCGNDSEARKDFRVYLVAHSMGGLICRCYLQNICRNGVRDAFDEESSGYVGDIERDLELNALPADPLVDKVFTYATPHNGIEFGGINVPDLGALDRLQAYNFNRKHMRKYLRLPESREDVDSLDEAFPENRFFCLVGTNYRDYEAFHGLSRRGTGPMSDGLVTMRNATVQGTPRAFVHRSHSGHYGIVNSEEGYQNLRRFLFGDLWVDVTLAVDEITLPKPIVEYVEGDLDRVRAAYNIEASAAIRGLNVMVNERRVVRESAIRRKYEQLVHDQKHVYLFSGGLLKRAKTRQSGDRALVFVITLGIEVPVYEVDNRMWFDHHFEGGYLFNDVITYEVRPTRKETSVRVGPKNGDGLGEAPRRLEPQVQGDRLLFEVPLGFAEYADPKPAPGMRGRLRCMVSRWEGP